MFDKEFYPTPKNVIEMMTAGLDFAGRTVLEPSAGKGDIVDYLKQCGANVIACERHHDLQRIVAGKSQFLKPDFFDVKAEEVSHIDFIIMNPPFSNADKHIQHAFDIAPGGCQIVALCNVETLKSRYSTARRLLSETVEKNGNWRSLGNVFNRAERTTDADVALINLFKSKSGDDEFEDYFFDTNPDDEQSGGPGIMKHNSIREIVNRYVSAVQMFDSVMAANKAINDMISPISAGLDVSFGAKNTKNQFAEITRDSFKKDLQKSAWLSVFKKLNMGKYVTSGVMADVNKFVEQQQHIPFTMTNVYRMIQLVVSTNASRMDRVLVEAFDHICSLSADNSEAGEKWKTNSSYKVNRRFIDTYVCEYDNRWPSESTKIRCGHRSEKVEDIIKGLCFLTGKNYDNVMNPVFIDNNGKEQRGHNSLYYFFSKNSIPWGQWVQWNDFFRVRGYKKGTMHFEFLDESVWMEFNRRVAKIKGWAIPKKTDRKKKGTERTKKAGVSLIEN